MKVSAQIDQAQLEDMELEVSVRMKVRDWRQLMIISESAIPLQGREFARRIREVLSSIEQGTRATLTSGER